MAERIGIYSSDSFEGMSAQCLDECTTPTDCDCDCIDPDDEGGDGE